MTNTVKKIANTAENWESGKLGLDPDFVEVAVSPPTDAEIDKALELRPISIRLENELIEDFKALSRVTGVGYQPLMRQVLKRFAHCELKRIANEYRAEQARLSTETEEQEAGYEEQDVA